MKDSITNKLDPVLAFLVFIFCFLTLKQVIPPTIYLLIGILFLFYFFPVKLFTRHWKKEIPENMHTIFFFSFLLVSIIISLSIVLVFYRESKLFYNIMLIVSIINILLAYIYFIKKYPNYLFVLHFSISFLPGAIIFA